MLNKWERNKKVLDYRNDIIDLMKATNGDKNSLKQSMVALQLICKLSKENSELEEKLESLSEKDTDIASTKVSKTIKEKDDTKLTTEKKSGEEATDNSEDSNKDEIKEDKSLTRQQVSAIKTANQKRERAALSDKVRKNQQKYAAKTSIPKLPQVKKIVHTVKPETEKFKVKRKLLGSEAVDDLGHTIQYFNEYTTREFNLNNGDTVELSSSFDLSDNRHILKVEHHPVPLTGDKEIVEFGPAVVQKDSFGLYVEKDSNGKHLSKFNSAKARYYIDLNIVSSFSIKENDLITIVWYKATPEYIKIRWKYVDDTPLVKKEAPKKKQRNNLLDKKKYKKLLHLRSKTDKELQENPEDYVPRISFDLDKKKVTIVVGDKGLTANLDKVIEAHNGTCRIIELKRPSDALRAAKESDYVILIQSYIKHGISQMLINSHNRNYSIAMATTSGQLAVEKALYRARYKLNVVDSDNIDYPFIKENRQD